MIVYRDLCKTFQESREKYFIEQTEAVAFTTLFKSELKKFMGIQDNDNFSLKLAPTNEEYSDQNIYKDIEVIKLSESGFLGVFFFYSP